MKAPTLKLGETMANRYIVESYLAAGGMQEVYIAHDISLNRKVVLKTPKEGVVDRRFRRGAEMGARVNHPNIAATLDYYEDENSTFLIEELIPGQDLGKRFEKDFYYLDPFLAAHVLHHITKGLAEAHRAGICHRDLKPSNIMASDDPGIESIKLTDFGIAKLAESEIAAEMELFDKDESTLTSSNTLLGAVPYMAPECWINWKGSGQPMDIWALGCIAYQLLTGAPPFGIGRAAIFNVGRLTHTGVQLNRPSWFGRNKATETLENDLWKLIESCLQVDENARPKASQLIVEFNSFCYASAKRRIGTVQRFKVPYADGGKGDFGFIDEEDEASSFFHRTVYVGDQAPSSGQRVSFSKYPGSPNPRCSPVLLVKPE